MPARAGYRRRGVFGTRHLGGSTRFYPFSQGVTEFVGHCGGSIDDFRYLGLDGLDWH